LIRVPIGRYVDTTSPVHDLDPRAKLLCFVALAVVSFFAAEPLEFALTYATIGVFIFLSNIPLRLYLRSLKSVVWIVALIVIFNALFTHGEVVFHYRGIIVTKEGLANGVVFSLRLTAAILFSSVLSHTTSPMALSRAVESLMKKVGFSLRVSQSTGMLFASAIRFVPVISEEAGRIWMAQKARGTPFDSRNPIKKITAMTSVIVPLIVLSLRRAEEFDLALRLRGYDPSRERTHFVELRWDLKSSLVMLATALVSVAMIV